MGMLAPLAPKLSKLFPMLTSDKDGEVVAAVRAIERTLKSVGIDFHTLADAIDPEPEIRIVYREPPKPKPDPERTWWEKACWCRDWNDGRLSDRELEFIRSMSRYPSSYKPSDKQLNWLNVIYGQLQAWAP